MIDFLQREQITVMFTALSLLTNTVGSQEESISSLVDTWIEVHDIELNGERNRGIYILKSRGMNSSNQVREFVITDHGIEVVELMVGPEGVLVGSARKAYELELEKEEVLKKYALERKNNAINRKRTILDNKIKSLTSRFEMDREELNTQELENQLKKEVTEKNRNEVMRNRKDKNKNRK